MKLRFLAVTEHPSHEAVFIPFRPIAALGVHASSTLKQAINGIYATGKLILKTPVATQKPAFVLI
jgi:hypothetical protein